MIFELTECNPNLKCTPQTVRWFVIRNVCKVITKLGMGNNISKRLASGVGATALHYAAREGNLEVMEELLSRGADPVLKNSLGQEPAYLCKAFSELQSLLKKRERKIRFRGGTKTTKALESFGKRISTANPVQYDMWLIPLRTLVDLYKDEDKMPEMKAHQDLRRQNILINWMDVPSDSEIIFVSHEWLSWVSSTTFFTS